MQQKAMMSFGRRLAPGLFIGLLALGPSRCGGGGGSQQTECPAGTEGCACLADSTCAAGTDLVCEAGVCQVHTCEKGTLGCPCFGNGTCNVYNGTQLVCESGTCAEPTCEPGTQGCPCLEDETCSDDLVCTQGTCAAPPCTAGTLGCPCVGDSDCATDNGTQLVCTEGECALPSCPEGALGCPCFANGTCDWKEGTQLACIDAVCALPDCPVGTLGCPCGTDNACGSQGETQLVCTDGICDDPGCPTGSQDCSCYSNGTCDDGLECQGVGPAAHCAPQTVCPQGQLDCPCQSDDTCDEGLFCQDGTCAELTCTPGAVGCICDGQTCTAAHAYCDEQGQCQLTDCPAGQEGCACTADQRCGLNPRGEQLLCEGGICAAPSCVPAETGCVCAYGTDCEDAANACQNGFCQPTDCVPGELDCPCAGGSCSPGLSCRDGLICADNTGYLGGPCFADDTCRRGGRCQNDVCAPCMLGSEGCACDDAGGCHAGLACVTGQCADADTVVLPPDQPNCYTPCQQGMILDDGTYQPCPADGLMPGCIGDLECVEGSCVLPGTEPPPCADDTDCPSFQTCIMGQCYANCDTDGQCPPNRVCQQHVCRAPCAASANDCPDGYACVTTDGEFGACQQIEQPSAVAQESVNGGFAVNATNIEFSNVTTSATITITNNSPAFESFTIRKRSHVSYFTDGTDQRFDDPADDGIDCNLMVDCPLVWLEMGEPGEEQRVQQLVVGVEGNGGKATVRIAGAEGCDAPRWDGRLEIRHAQLGVRDIVVTYTERPEGRWSGKIYYFANFGERKLAEWRATPASRDDSALIAQVGNAFIQRWGAFRKGNLSWLNLLAVLTATQSESWRWSDVVENCPASQGACYPYDNSALGLEIYTSNRSSNPVPTGVTELPLALNLRLVDAQQGPGRMEGRIESSLALQYPGNPAIALQFGADPAGCQRTTGGACLVFVESLQADILLGGRYETDSADTQCSARSGDGFELRRYPWLIPGFQRATETDGTSGLDYRFECRDSFLPFNEGPDTEISEDFAQANLSLTAANPIPDGRTRRRTIRLVDGALVNQTHLFIIFQETFESFLPADQQPFSAYGYMVLQREPADFDLADDNGNEIADIYEGSVPEDSRPEPDALLDVQCSEDLVHAALGWDEDEVTEDNAARMVLALIDGLVPGETPEVIAADSDERVHYLCVDTGLFNGGSQAFTDPWLEMPNDDMCGGETNPYAFDDDCDDGRWGADSSLCPAGTDYDDCGSSDDGPNNNTCGFNNHYAGNGSCDDGGPDSDTSICPIGTDDTDCGQRSLCDGDFRVACPAASDVIFFTTDTSMTEYQIAMQDCQDDHSCQNTLNEWMSDPASPLIQYQPSWRCEDSDNVYCDRNRLDLRDGKVFYAASEEQAVFTPLYPEIDLAFRYKTRFRGRTGESPGFAPQICIPQSNQVPYCYDPPAIEGIRERADCLLSIWRNHYEDVRNTADIGNEARTALDEFLCTNFSYAEACHSGMDTTVPHDGFERLYAELLVMMGDESYTQSFASRFDLAGQSAVSFEGTLFEPEGLNLSGAAGYEMYSLYQAVQYYQEALDRFYSMSPLMWEALSYQFDARNFVTPETVTWYFERLIRASTQKSRAWSEVAKHYQDFNRPDLARLVIERAYPATYLEGILLSQLMLRIVDTLRPEDRPQVIQVLEDGQRRYRMAMLDMQKLYDSISDNLSFFGLPPDYIPFPALNPMEYNAFEVLLSRARQKVDVARYREEQAIQRSTAFETDAAEFQAELIRLRNNYETQLGQICGTFEGTDGRIYPAIARYAQLNERAKWYGDPCGLMGNGAIYESIVQFEQAQIDVQRINVSLDNVLTEVEIERARVSAQCDLIVTLADFVYEQQGEMNNMQRDIQLTRMAMSAIDRSLGIMSTLAQLSKCSVGTSTDCPMAAAAVSWYGATTIALNGLAIVGESFIFMKEQQIASINRDLAHWQSLSQCDAATIDSNARTATMMLRVKEIELDALRSAHQLRLELSQIQGQKNTAKRLEMELAETEQLTINTFAARNDPNVRIYRNDAIVNADISFEDAMREVYRATKVYEYYTSQSYADLEKLFLIRMVQFGEYNLENYITALENAFYEFEESYGLPDTRVAVISLRDDIMHIPRLDNQGRALSQSERIDMMRAKLLDPALLDENGYLTLAFSTRFDDLSPLTRNHKIYYMEAEVIGSDVGDTVGRLYARQQGTSVVHGVSGDLIYYRFPERTAVLNPFFNGNRIFAPDVYHSERMRDRPFINTAWQLILNQRDEPANQDLNLQSLTDIRVYVYYHDFTEM